MRTTSLGVERDRLTPRPRAPALLRAGARLEPGDELVELELLEPLPDRIELGGADLDEPAALLAELERLAQAGVAGVQTADDLLEAARGLLVGGALGVGDRDLGLLAHLILRTGT